MKANEKMYSEIEVKVLIVEANNHAIKQVNKMRTNVISDIYDLSEECGLTDEIFEEIKGIINSELDVMVMAIKGGK